jgi:hypothetical protein
VETTINNYEPVFQLGFAVVLFCRVLIEAKGRFPFEMRGLVLSGRDRWFQRGRFFAPTPWHIF